MTSRAVVGSSAISRRGRQDSAIAIMTRCAHAAGDLVRVGGKAGARVGNTKPFQHLLGDRQRPRAATALVQHDRVGDLVPHGIDRVQAAHRFLEHHGDLVAPDAAQRPAERRASVADLSVASAEFDRAGHVHPGPARDEAHDCQAGDRLTGAGLTDQHEGFKGRMVKETPSTAWATPASVWKCT